MMGKKRFGYLAQQVAYSERESSRLPLLRWGKKAYYFAFVCSRRPPHEPQMQVTNERGEIL